MKKASAAKRPKNSSSVGNRALKVASEPISSSKPTGVAENSQLGDNDQLSCRVAVNSVDTFAAWGSNQVLRSHGGYGPWRDPHPFKLRGGGLRSSAQTGQQPSSPGAPSSSTSVQVPRDTAERGTPQARLVALLVDIMDEGHAYPSSNFLTPGQQALYDLCKKDLDASRHDFETHWTIIKGQQFLVDLRRMENTLHKILAVQGDVPHLATNVYVVAQALTSILRNPQNMCFGNSVFRCWSWAGAHAEDQSIAWGRTHDAVRQFLSADQPSLLHELTQMHHVLQHFQAGRQADIGDFAGHLWSFSESTFFGGKFFHVHADGRLEDREQIPLNLLFPDGEHPLTLDEVVNSWANEDGGQYLYGTPDGLIVHLQRSALLQGQWTKLNRALEFGTSINIPFSDDGIHVHQATYRIVSMILHQGQGHENGHYVTIHAMDNAYWLADDDQYPQPLGQISQQQQQEVVQLWLIHDQQELVPDTVEALQPSQAKRAKHHYETLHLVFANVTSFGGRVQDWIWTKGDHLLCLQETHLGDKKLAEVQQYFTARGWKTHGAAATNTGRGGNTGGFLTLHGPRHITHLDHSYNLDGNGWMSIGLQRQDSMIFIIQLYLKTGETLQSPSNADILGALLNYLSHIRAPFILGGDWQNDPGALAATVIQSRFRAEIMDTKGPTTLQGAQLDYLLVSNSLVQSITVAANWEVPWKPHCALEVTFNCDYAAIPVQQLQRFPPIGNTHALPAAWTSFWEDDGPFHIMGQPISGLGSDFARWATQTEKYLTQLLHNPTTGRGSKISIYQAPLVDHTRSQTWKKGSVAYWDKMKIRVNIVHQAQTTRVAQDLLNMLDSLHQHASDNMSQDLFRALLTHWIQHPENEPLEIRRIMAEEEQLAHKAIFASTNDEYRVWLEKAHHKGLRGLFRCLRQKDVPWQRPHQHLPLDQRQAARQQQWDAFGIPGMIPDHFGNGTYSCKLLKTKRNSFLRFSPTS